MAKKKNKAQVKKENVPELEVYEVAEEAAQQDKAHSRRAHRLEQSQFKNLLIVGLIVIILIMGVWFGMSHDPFSRTASMFSKNYPGGVLTMQQITAEQSKSVAEQVKGVCPSLAVRDYYFVTMSKQGSQDADLYLVNPATGSVDCKVTSNSLKNPTQSSEQKVIATVNGAPVYDTQVLAIYNAIPEASRTNTTIQQSFDQAVNNKLLEQEARKRGISVSIQEVDSAIQQFLAANNLNMQSLETSVVSSGSTMAAFRSEIEGRLLLQKLIVEVTNKTVSATEADASTYYAVNKGNLTSAGRSVSRQLTIYANQSNSEEKLAFMQQIARMYNGTNICLLISQYSEDKASAQNCGLYDAAGGQLLPEYESAMYASKPGEVKVVPTRIGFHLVEVISVEPPKVLTYDDAKLGIINYLTFVKKQQVLDSFIASLRQGADIKTISQ